jgi:hypothetical protein
MQTVQRKLWLAAGVAGALLLFVLALPHAARAERIPATCVFRAITHVPCPTCGSTRAALALASGEVGLAFRYNPLISAAWLLLPAALLGTLVFRPRWRSLSLPTRRWAVRGLVLLLVIAGLANWVYLIRNLRELERESGRRTRSDTVQAMSLQPGGLVPADAGTLNDR